ncbi:MAG: secondary thiamine-phosphate synthase enzyme YjbQ [Cyanobacteria bacterium]|nr:secondary thiamine-phosphate synthase enzyme YjbQ [Cyanobacteriota bacterium]
MTRAEFRSPVASTIHLQRSLRISTHGKTLHNITQPVQDLVIDSGVDVGLCTLFVRHTSASLVIQENADPDVLWDLEAQFQRLVPEDDRYRHSAEGPDDMPAHLRTALTHTSEQVPITGGRLALGTWQGIYLWEHRQRSHAREVVVHIMGGRSSR